MMKMPSVTPSPSQRRREGEGISRSSSWPETDSRSPWAEFPTGESLDDPEVSSGIKMGDSRAVPTELRSPVEYL